jgi:hypothetical protein
MFLNLYKTSSRGPWIAAIIGLALSLLFGNRSMRLGVLLICLSAVTILVTRPGVWTTITNLYRETINPDTAQGESYQWRWALYSIAFERLNNDIGRALVGFGPESFFYLRWHGTFGGRTVIFESCDSSIAALMIETGYVGMILTVLLPIRALSLAHKHLTNLRASSDPLPKVIGISIIVFSFMMTNVLIFGWGQQSFLFWILLSMIAIYPQLASDIVNAPRSQSLMAPARLLPSFTTTHGSLNQA